MVSKCFLAEKKKFEFYGGQVNALTTKKKLLSNTT